MPDEKQSDLVPVSFKLTPLGRSLLERLAKAEGLSMTGIIETSVRRLARERGWQIDDEKKDSEAA